jgi:hypothetical protein
LISCSAVNESAIDCTLPVPNGILPSEADISGLWHYQLTDGNSKEWKSCEFKADHLYSCEIFEQGPIDSSGKLLEVDSYTQGGNWKLDGDRFTYWLPFNIVAFSKNSFQIKNDAGYSELFYKNKACASSL